MKLVIMQPYLFPYVGYFQLLAAADRFVVYDDVNFIKRGWINRNQLLVNGQPWLFTVPLDQPSQNRLINEIHVRPSAEWRPKLIQTIQQNYQRAPYYELVFPMLKTILETDVVTIADLVRISLNALVSYLELPVKIVPSSVVYGNAHLKAQERILDICRQERATCYINALGGRSLYTDAAFQEHDIELRFLQPELKVYPQVGSPAGFVPGLSIIDVLMNNSKEATRDLLQQYTLIRSETVLSA